MVRRPHVALNPVSCVLPVLVTCKTWVCVATQAEVGAPGVVVGVSVDGTQVWTEGFYTLIYLFIQLPLISASDGIIE